MFLEIYSNCFSLSRNGGTAKKDENEENNKITENPGNQKSADDKSEGQIDKDTEVRVYTF